MRGLWFSALALALAAPVAAQDAPGWRPVDAETGKISAMDALQQLVADFPDSASVRRRLLSAQLTSGDVAGAFFSLEWLRLRGYVFGAATRTQIVQMVGEEHAAAASALLLTRIEPIEASTLVATAPAEAGLVESVFAPDVENDPSLAVTSITDRAVWISDGEDWQRFAPAYANDLSALVSDDVRNVGWASSANIDGSEDAQPGFSGLIPVSSNEAIEPVRAPDGVVLSDLTIDARGTIYASDPVNGGIYRRARDADAITALVEPGVFRSPQGLAPASDGRTLYVSDYSYGLAIIDTQTGAVSRLASDVPAQIDGIDGLFLFNGELIAIQNGTSPMRIVALALSSDGSRIVGERVLEQAHGAWTEPLGGSIANGALIYVATGQWDRYDKGQLKPGMIAEPTQIRRLPLIP